MTGNRSGQSTMAYIVLLVAILVAVVFAARRNGPIDSGMKGSLEKAKDIMTKGVDDGASRFQ